MIIFVFVFTFLFCIDESLVLSVGEQREIPIKQMTHFSLGSDIVTQTYLADKQVFIIKGKKVGHTDIIIWNKEKIIYKNEIYCLSKAHEMKLFPIINLIKKTHLSAKLNGPLVQISGLIQDQNDLDIIEFLKKEYKKSLLIQTKYDPQFTDNIIAKIYKSVYAITNIPFYCSCEINNIQCIYESNTILKQLNFLEEKYHIELIHRPRINNNNYILKLKIIQIQNNEGQDFSIGPGDITTDLATFFTTPIKAIAEKNLFILSEQKASLSTLASTQIQIQLGKKAKIELGSERPYQVASIDRPRIEWKFSGLKMDFTINKIDEEFSFDYKTELTQAGLQDSIEGHKGESQIIITKDKAQILFHIGLQGKGRIKKSLPFLSYIPIIGEIFRPTQSHMAFSKVYLVALLTNKDEEE